MATIAPNDSAPADFHHLSLANAELDFSSGPVETDDAVVLANAEAHPWVYVEYPEVEPEEGPAHVVEVAPVAIEAGLDQNEAVEEEGVALTVAAAARQEPHEEPATTDTAPTFTFGADDKEPRS